MSFTPLYNHPANYPTSILGYTNKPIIGTSEFIKNYNPPTLPIPLYQQNWNKQITAKTEFSFRPYQTFIEFRHNHYLNNPIYQGHGILPESNNLTQYYLNNNIKNNNKILKGYQQDYEILNKTTTQ